jgi:hypothetical protein
VSSSRKRASTSTSTCLQGTLYFFILHTRFLKYSLDNTGKERKTEHIIIIIIINKKPVTENSHLLFLISNFSHVLNVVCFLLGNYPEESIRPFINSLNTSSICMTTDAPGKCLPHTKHTYVYKTIAKAVEK